MSRFTDEVEPELRGCKFVPIIISGAAAANNVYFLNRDVDVEKHIITGIEWDDVDTGRYPAQWIYNGVLVNTITAAAMAIILMNYRDKGNKYLMRNKPGTSFLPQQLSAPAMNLSLDLSTSYIKFVLPTIAPAIPIIIPVMYYFDRGNVFNLGK